jgi:hypothetical protein
MSIASDLSRKETGTMDHGGAEHQNNGHDHAHGHATDKAPPSAISRQLRDELIRILTTGDVKNDGAFTVAVATHIEKFAVAAREILMTESLAQTDLASLMMTRRNYGYLGSAPNLWNPITGLSSSDSSMGVGPSPSVNNENFGVQAIRQVVDAIRTMGESPSKLVEAIAAAREHNLPDIAAGLEKKLGVTRIDAVPDESGDEAAMSNGDAS